MSSPVLPVWGVSRQSGRRLTPPAVYRNAVFSSQMRVSSSLERLVWRPEDSSG